MHKLTKTEVKIRTACAYQGLCDMTVLMEHIEKGDLDLVRRYAESWLDVYTQRFEEYKNALQ